MKVFLNYYTAKEYAKEHKLKECEYGDIDENISYCAWNKSGDRNDEWEVEACYKFETEEVEKNGYKYIRNVPEKEISIDLLNWAKLVLEIPLDDIEDLCDVDCPHESIEWGDDDERGECLDCGATCDWHWAKDVVEGEDCDGNYTAKEVNVREVLQWHPRGL